MKEFVAALLRLLHERNIPYAIGGSIASSYYGEPRTTQDIDLSVQLGEGDVARFAAACEALGWYLSLDEVTRAVRAGGWFSLNDGFWKADIFVVRDDEFAQEAFARRRQGTFSAAGETAWFLTPEDVIVHKLRWCEGQPLDKHVRDIVAILHIQGTALDLAYITRWSAAVGTGGLWAAILDRYRTDEGD